MNTLAMQARMSPVANIVLRNGQRRFPKLSAGGASCFLVSLVSVAGLAEPAHAEEFFGEPLQPKAQAHFWKNFGGASHHFKNPERFNQDNAGFGIEYTLDRDRSLVIGEYLNSVNLPTRYFGGAWAPLHYGPIKLGVVAGLADGYPIMNGGGFFPMVLPLVAVEAGRVGVNFTVIPSIAGKGSGCVAMQLKFRYR
jgi:hypothetical protein